MLAGEGMLRKKRFAKFCENFAAAVGAKSGKAVSRQIRFAVGVQSQNGMHHWDASQARVAMLNMAARDARKPINSNIKREQMLSVARRIILIIELFREPRLAHNDLSGGE
jgi:hypothetical protein